MFVHRPDARLLSLSFGQGPLTLLALGGWVGSGEVWHELFGHLPHWRCVSFDHRGSGVSTHSGPISIDTMVDDLFAVADAQQALRPIDIGQHRPQQPCALQRAALDERPVGRLDDQRQRLEGPRPRGIALRAVDAMDVVRDTVGADLLGDGGAVSTAQLALLDGYAATKEDGESFASGKGLSASSVAY